MRDSRNSTLLIPFLLLVFSSCSGQGRKPQKKDVQKYDIEKLSLTPDAATVKFLGNLNSKFIFNPNEVIFFTLEGVKTPDTSSVMLGKHVIRKKYGTVSPDVFLPFQLLLSDSSFYRLDDMQNKCLFVPDVAFECKIDNESVLILISLSCEQIGIEYKGNLKFEEFNFREIVLRYIASLAHDDKFIAAFHYLKNEDSQSNQK